MIWTLSADREIAPHIQPEGQHEIAFLASTRHHNGLLMANNLAWVGERLWQLYTLFNDLVTNQKQLELLAAVEAAVYRRLTYRRSLQSQRPGAGGRRQRSVLCDGHGRGGCHHRRNHRRRGAAGVHLPGFRQGEQHPGVARHPARGGHGLCRPMEPLGRWSGRCHDGTKGSFIAERKRLKWDYCMGSRGGGRSPGSFAESLACPEDRRTQDGREHFVPDTSQFLQPVPSFTTD